MKKEKEAYQLTVKGLLGDEKYSKVMLYMYRIGVNGIALDKGNLDFAILTKEE